MSRASERKRRKDWLGAGLIVSVLAIATFVLYMWSSSKLPQTDKKTLCPADGPRSVTAVLIDTTDPLSVVQHEAVRKQLDEIKDDVPRYGELALYTVRASGERLLKPELVICNPGRGAEVSRVYENPRLVENRWRQEFSAQVHDVLNSLLAQQPADSSPIMESIQQLAVEVFYGRYAAGIPKRLILVSDLIQNTSGISQYRGIEPFDQFKGSSYYWRLRPELRDVEVTILYLRRPNSGVQGKKHLMFWREYFADAGAQVTGVALVNG